MKNMKSTKKKRNQDVCLRFSRLAAGLLHVLHALHGEKVNRRLPTIEPQNMEVVAVRRLITFVIRTSR
jgi:hypothetical protein